MHSYFLYSLFYVYLTSLNTNLCEILIPLNKRKDGKVTLKHTVICIILLRECFMGCIYMWSKIKILIVIKFLHLGCDNAGWLWLAGSSLLSVWYIINLGGPLTQPNWSQVTLSHSLSIAHLLIFVMMLWISGRNKVISLAASTHLNPILFPTPWMLNSWLCNPLSGP